jgi:hypothetical protein
MLTKQVSTFVDRITEDGSIHVKIVTRVYEDGEQIGSDSIHRKVIAPGESIEGEDACVCAVADAVWQSYPQAVERVAAKQVAIKR